MIFNTHYAYGAGVSGAVIVVTAPTGSTVTATLGSKTLTATEKNGTWTFQVKQFGEWTITATLNSSTKISVVNVTEKTTYNVTITYTVNVNVKRTGNGVQGSGTFCYVLINDEKVYETGVYPVSIGDTITCIGRLTKASTVIQLNGKTVASAGAQNIARYAYEVNSDVNIAISYYGGTTNTYIKITE